MKLRELLCEAIGLGLFLLVACLGTVALQHPGSPLAAHLPSPLAGRIAMGAAMGLTAAALIYSPLGKRSGAHLNPSVSLSFFLLGRISARDAASYAAAQLVGGVAGVALALLLVGDRLAHPAVQFAATVPGPAGASVAFAAELAISFATMLTVLLVSSSRRPRLTGLCASALVMLFIVLEAPLSGMSMNPARSLASALFLGSAPALWIYFVAPPLGMACAAWLLRGRPGCAKLDHAPGVRCRFCEERAAERPGRRPRVVVLGGGFGGVFTARALERLRGDRDDFEIVLVAKDNYFVFQPMLPEVISGTIGLLDLVSPLRHLLPSSELHLREVEAVDLAGRTVATAPGFHPRQHLLPWDRLVLALGTVTDFRGLRGLPEHALPFKDLKDALRLRNHAIRAIEEAAIEKHDPQLRRQLLTFVVAGGGFSGVEVVAELNDFVREVARREPGIDPSELRVVLVHSQPRILPEVPERLGRFAERILRERGVELILNTRLAAATGTEAQLAGGTRIPTRTLVSTVPSSPHPLVERLELRREKGRIVVDRELRVEGHAGVWALGDCAQVPTALGTPAPPTAQHALRQAEVVAANVVASLRGGATRSFTFRGLGKMGSLGRRSAVADLFGLQLSGVLAWFLWRTIYLSKLPGWGRRAKVAAAWTFDLFLPPELVQLKLGDEQGILREHFEPGQEVFHQGDLGDRVYAITSGEAEVVVEQGGAEKVVARLGSGAVFGEMALLDDRPRSATIRSATPLDVWSLPKQEFQLLAEGMPELRQGLEKLRDQRRQRSV
jgi:NADH dehydrogenase